MSMETKNDVARRRAFFSVAFVLLSVVVLLIIFLVNKDKILTNLKETNFFEKIFGATPAIIENHQVKQDENGEMPLREDFISGEVESSSFPELKSVVSENADGGGALGNLSGSDSVGFVGEFGTPGTFGHETENNVASGAEVLGTAENREDVYGDEGNVTYSGAVDREAFDNSVLDGSSFDNRGFDNRIIDNRNAVGTENNVIIKDVAPKAAVATASFDLCFVMIDGDGAVLRKIVKRSVPKSDSPLTTAINLLLEGPDVRNKAEAECRSLIPEGSKLLSARVSDGVAYLNFNEEFEFNPFGVEGAIHQLEQIVYTATSFSTVNSVQFLIEGQKREYLGSEGQWIGTPLSRANF